MGAMNELDIARQELEETGMYVVMSTNVAEQQYAEVKRSRITIDHARKLLYGALMYAHNPYQDGETEYDEWHKAVLDFINKHSPIK